MYGSVAGVIWMIVKVVVIPFLGFNFVIGSVVHVHHIASRDPLVPPP